MDIEATVETGLGYSPAEDRKATTVGLVPVDALFSPVVRVNFAVESTRVGRLTNYDKLTLEITTNGTTTPQSALTSAAQTLVDYFSAVVNPQSAPGPAGPTTATRMDKYTELMLGQLGLLGMIGKGERGPQAIEAIKRHKGVSLIAVGGAAYLVSKAIRAARVVAFEDLGMEAIHEFTVEDMPVTVAVDSAGHSVHETGPLEWRGRIGKIPVRVG